MSKSNGVWIGFVIAGLALLLGPFFVRTVVLGYNQRVYVPDEDAPFSAAAAPAATATPFVHATTVSAEPYELRPGPVVIDLAHGNGVGRNRFEPLAAALANRGIGVRFWMSDVDPMRVTSFLDYPDQSEELQAALRGASGLVVVSPFFLWSKPEIAVAEQFVADGGRLLLISDPDVSGDLSQDINNLGEPFGIVFAGDYLYDTTVNDGNHIHVFAGEFEDDFESLADSRIAFYGTRSISGDVTPQVLATGTALSNLRTGVSGLSTIVKGGLASRGTEDGVLAMGDFDVLTAPFLERHDNASLTAQVADFLASGERSKSVTDFPAMLGKDVTLVLANGAVGGQMLEEGSALQRILQASGRTLTVAGTGLLTQVEDRGGASSSDTTSNDPTSNDPTSNDPTSNDPTSNDPTSNDMIVLADYALVEAETTLLDDLGFTLVAVTPTPTVTPEPMQTPLETLTPSPSMEPPDGAPSEEDSTPTPFAPDAAPQSDARSVTATSIPSDLTPSAPAESGDVGHDQSSGSGEGASPRNQSRETPAALLTPTATFTPTPSPTVTPSPTETATPSPTPTVAETPKPEVYLVAEDGLRLVAADTVIVSQQQLRDGRRAVAVMGNDADGIRSGVERLLSGKFSGCVTSTDLAICTVPNGDGDAKDTSSGMEHPDAPIAESTEESTDLPARPSTKLVMVIDDDDLAAPGEASEADIYIKVLAREGYGPTLWTTASDGIPKLDDLTGYDWVIWSSGGYEAGGPGLADLDALLGYINDGGNLTISSRKPFFGMSANEPSVIADVAVDDDLPPMVYGLPSTAIALEDGLPPVTPLQIGEEHAGAKIVLLRGPNSGDAEAPLLFVVVDDKGDKPTGARLMVAGMSLTWLPDDYSDQLVHNMAGYMADD